jgi:hypothetical protein
VDDPVHLEDRVVVRRRVRGLEAASLVDRDVDEYRSGAHEAEHLARHELRRDGARDEDGPDHHVGVGEGLLDLEPVRHRERHPSVERDLELAHSVDRLVEHPDVRLHAERDDRGVEADDAASEHHDLGRRHARDTAEKDAAAAVSLLERPGAHLRREPARDLAHRREEREPPVGGLDRLVRDAGHAGVEQRPRERLVGGDVEVGEEGQPLAKPRILRLDRLLHLEQELGRCPDLLDVGEPRANGRVRLVGESRADARPMFDDHVVAALDELERAGRRQGDAVLLRLDLLRHPDPHGGRDDTAPSAD